MKHEKLLTALTGAALALLLSAGTVGCFVSAFDLNLEHTLSVAGICAGFAVLGAVAFSFRHGGAALLCLLALLLGYSYHDGRAAGQFWQLLHRLTTVYDRAYGWGVLVTGTPWNAGFADWPMGVLGAVVSLSVCRCICRGTSTWGPVMAAVLPLLCCVVVTDTVPGELWLLMVLSGLILLILPSAVRSENRLQGLRLTAAAVLPVVLTLLALFLAVPREGYVNQTKALQDNMLLTARNLPQMVQTTLLELSENIQGRPQKRVNLASLSSRLALTYPVMKVKAENSGILYLREQDYDIYDGQTWTSSGKRQEEFHQTGGSRERIRIQTHGWKELRYLPYYPGEQTTLTGGSLENEEEVREYTLTRCSLPEDWRQTAYASSGMQGTRQWSNYLYLPEATRQEASAMLSGLFTPGASNTEKADIIAAMVTNSARYDLNIPKMPSSEPDFALWFLRQGDRGYCIHFATAATVLLRAAEIPARYVTGYMVKAVGGENVTVTEENAHAWAEYYEPGLGLWIPLEATPASDTPAETLEFRPAFGEEEAEQTLQTQLTEETAPEAAQTEAEEPVQETAAATESEHEPELPAVTAPQSQMPQQTASRRGGAWLLVLLGGLLLPVQRRVRLSVRRRRLRKAEPNRQALLYWQETVQLSRLLKEQPPEALIRLAQKAKFSQHRMGQEELSQFTAHNRACRQRLREKPWPVRLIHRFVFAAY